MAGSFRLRKIIPLSILIVLLSCWQYFYCAQQTPPGWRFLGFTCDAGDQHTYLSLMERARSGQFFLDNLYSGEVERPVYWNFFWWKLGTVARFTGLSLATVFHTGRVVCSFALLLLLARCISYFVRGDKERWCAFVLIALGTGYGWLLVLGQPIDSAAPNAADLSIPEAFAFLSILWKPHFVFALCLQITIYWLFLNACETGKPTRAIGAALATLLLGFSHAFHLVTIYSVVLVFALLWSRRHEQHQWRPLQYSLLLIALSSPALLYLIVITRISPMMAAWRAQNICLSPPLWSYLLGFGPLVLPLLLCPRALIQLQKESPRNLFLLVWVLCNAVLLYTGGVLSFERRLVQGLQIPLALLSVQVFMAALHPAILQSRAVEYCLRRGWLSRRTFGGTLVLLWILSALPTSLYHFTTTSFAALPPRSPGLYYVSRDEAAVANYLREHTPEDAVILAPEVQSSWLPHQAARRVFVGHTMQTMNYPEKSRLAARFFAGQMTPAEYSRFLHDFSIDFIYWPKTNRVQPPISSATTKVFDTPEIAVLRVEKR